MEVLEVEIDGQSASGHPVKKRTKMVHSGAGGYDEDIQFHTSKM